MTTLPVDDVYLSLQAASRHRHHLVKHKSIALPIALKFSSADAITQAGVDGIARYLRNAKVRFQVRTIERAMPLSISDPGLL